MNCNNESLLDKEFHFKCEYYNRCSEDAAISLVRIGKDCVYERDTTVPEVIIICNGEGTVTIAEHNYCTLDAGQMIIVPPLVVLSVAASEQTTVMFMKVQLHEQECLRLNLEQLNKYKRGAVNIFNVAEVKPKLRFYLGTLIPFLEDGLLCSKYLNAKITEFIHILAGYYTLKELALFFRPLLDDDLLFRNTIEKNIHKYHCIEEFALLTKMSRAGFYDKFRRVFGVSPKQYIRCRRAEMIRRDLLETDVPFKSLASHYGFRSYEVFFRFCLKMLESTPSKIRLAGK